jgi:hypothetical protein
MWLRRGIRGLTVLIGTFVPIWALWFLTAIALDREDAAYRSAQRSPNPGKAPHTWLGLVELLGSVDHYLADNINLWRVPGIALVALLVLWAMGVPVFTKERATGQTQPSLTRVVVTSLAVGMFLGLPWLFALFKVLTRKEPW